MCISVSFEYCRFVIVNAINKYLYSICGRLMRMMIKCGIYLCLPYVHIYILILRIWWNGHELKLYLNMSIGFIYCQLWKKYSSTRSFLKNLLNVFWIFHLCVTSIRHSVNGTREICIKMQRWFAVSFIIRIIIRKVALIWPYLMLHSGHLSFHLFQFG